MRRATLILLLTLCLFGAAYLVLVNETERLNREFIRLTTRVHQ